MSILQKLNSKANLRKTSGGDLPYQTSYPVIARYEADSTASQTLINMTFSVDQANKESFQLFIDGKLLREGSSNDFTFTSIQADNTSSQITLNAPIDANLNIVAIKLGLRVDSLSSGSSAVSSGGSKNYFSLSNANPDFEKNVTSPWLPCTLTWSGTAPSGAPTLTATNMTLSVSNSNPLIGSYSMLLTKAPANSQYQGLISGGLTIDREDVAKVLYGSFSYELVSGAADFSGTSTQTYEIWVWNYDPANPSVGQWIQPAGYRGMNQSSGVGKVVFSFQTDGTFTNNAYKVAVITQQTGTGAIVVKFDDFVLGPQAIVLGTPVTDWQSFSGVSSWTTGTLSAWEKRVGDSAHYRFFLTLTGTPSGELTFNLPSGRSVDTSKILGIGQDIIQIGKFKILKQGVNYWSGDVNIFASSGTAFKLRYSTSAGATSPVPTNTPVTATSPASFVSGDIVEVEILNVPIAGWSSSSQVSSDTDTRVVAVLYRDGTNSFTVGTTVATPFSTKVIDTHAAWNGNTFTVPVTGYYNICGGVNLQTADAGQVRLYVDGIEVQNMCLNTASSNLKNFTGAWSLNAGQQVTIRYTQSVALATSVNPTYHWLSINRVSGPSVITATETVACEYVSTAVGSTLTTATPLFVDFPTKQGDTHNAVLGAGGGINATATNTWRFVAPISGRYSVSYGVSFTIPLNSNTDYAGMICVDGVGVRQTVRNNYATVNNSGVTVGGSAQLQLTAGQYVSIRIYQSSGANRTLTTNANENWVTVVRVGN